MADADKTPFDAVAVARDLAGVPVDVALPVAGSGRNSRIYRVEAGGRVLCLKHFMKQGVDPRDRLGTEMNALELMARHGVAGVPAPLARDHARGCALMTWIEGAPVAMPGAADVAAALQFLGAIHVISRTADAVSQPLASEACLSVMEIIAQLARRLRRLGSLGDEDSALAAFIERLSRFLFTRVVPAVVEGYGKLGLATAAPLPLGLRSLCPSDFGFHNALRGAEGLVFLDFDYFGWDDPVKLVADFVLHPGMQLGAPLKRQFLDGAIRLYGADATFAPRLNLLFALFALRWCLILLNEFLPERWAIRLHAGLQNDEWTSIKRMQLERAASLFDITEATFPKLPIDV